MRRFIGVTVACGALTITAVVPASAENLASQDVANAYSIMMTNSEGKSVISGNNMMRQFTVLSAESGAADVPWLCDLTGSDEVEGKGGEGIATMEFFSEKGQAAAQAVQEIHVYSN